MARNVAVIVSEILEAIDVIREALGNMPFGQFQTARVQRLAVQRAVEIISEAARHLPVELLDRHPTTDWRGIKAIGNILRHAYHDVNDKLIWDVVTLDLPLLEAIMRSELSGADRPADGSQ